MRILSVRFTMLAMNRIILLYSFNFY